MNMSAMDSPQGRNASSSSEAELTSIRASASRYRSLMTCPNTFSNYRSIDRHGDAEMAAVIAQKILVFEVNQRVGQPLFVFGMAIGVGHENKVGRMPR